MGRDNANKSSTIRGFTLTAAQRADLVAFLQSLTDEELLRDPRFANPCYCWVAGGAQRKKGFAMTGASHPTRTPR